MKETREMRLWWTDIPDPDVVQMCIRDRSLSAPAGLYRRARILLLKTAAAGGTVPGL